MKYSNVKLDPDALLRLRVLDTCKRMETEEGKIDVWRFCKLMGISKAWFYKWKGRYNSRNLNTLKSHSRKPKTFKTIPWEVVVEIALKYDPNLGERVNLERPGLILQLVEEGSPGTG